MAVAGHQKLMCWVFLILQEFYILGPQWLALGLPGFLETNMLVFVKRKAHIWGHTQREPPMQARLFHICCEYYRYLSGYDRGCCSHCLWWYNLHLFHSRLKAPSRKI